MTLRSGKQHLVVTESIYSFTDALFTLGQAMISLIVNKTYLAMKRVHIMRCIS